MLNYPEKIYKITIKKKFMNQYWLISIVLGTCFYLTSCQDELYRDNESTDARTEAPVVCKILPPVVLEDSSTMTRAANPLPEDKINNIWVFQFAGTEDNSIMVGDPLYFDLNASQQGIIKVSTSGGAKHRLVFIANNNDSNYKWLLLSGVATYADLQAKTKDITSGSFPDTDPSIPMTAEWTGVIDATQVASGFDISFVYSVAKIELELKFADELEEGFQVRSVQLKQIPSKMRWCDGLIKMTDETVVFPGTAYAYIDYEAVTNRLPAKNAPQTYVWYLPRNHQGVSANTSVNQKNNGAKSSATYIEILATDKDMNDIRFRLYPGKNMLNNFNITSNYVYNIPLTISGAGDPNTDSRVEHLSKVVFPKANSYILNPPEIGSGAKVFYIPIERVNDFWADPAYELIGQDMKKAFTESTRWKCQVIWTDNNTLYSPDISVTDRLTFIGNSGQGISNQYLRVRLPALTTSQHGNVVVGIYRTDEAGNIQGGCAWSWHLWVTDYNPDVQVQVSEQLHVYPVPGGQVERYGGVASGYSASWVYTSWTATTSYAQPYAGKLVMDRYLGIRSEALTSFPNWADQSYYMLYSNPAPFYQIARKDPIPPIGRYAIYDKDNNITYNEPINTPQGNIRKLSNYCGGTKIEKNSLATMATAIEEPDKFYFPSQALGGGSYSWIRRIDDGYRTYITANFMWGDLKRSTYSPNKWDKTLFDPCPPGWRLPGINLWKDEFTDTDGRTNSDKNGRTLLASKRDGWYGIRYWPYKMVGTAYPVDGTIFYPSWASLNNVGESSSRLVVRGVDGYLCLATNQTYPSFVGGSMNEGGMVRCIQE